MRQLVVVLVLSLTTIAGAVPASAGPPPGAISGNVEYVTTIPELRTAIGIAFDGDLMIATTVHGVYAYDVADVAAPQLLGALPMYIWENEDIAIDTARKRVFVSRDPRGFTTPASSGSTFPYGAVHIVDYSNPHVLRQVGFFTLEAGHTSTCINDCDYLWTGGPGANSRTQPADWRGRPIFATDVRDPANPVTCPAPIDLGRNDGVTDYAHDVQVDSDGIAWVSGAGGVRGYWTEGVHWDPVLRVEREATACEPVPYGGGGTPADATPSRFMHNSLRPVDAAIPGDDASQGHVLYATEEALGSQCASTGRFATYDLRTSLGGAGFVDGGVGFRMTALDTWTPEAADGADGCASAHYFDRRTSDGMLAYSFYSQGVRFLDASDPRAIRQVGYYRPDDANAFASYWHGDAVFVADFTRGVDILRFRGDTDSGTVRAPLRQLPAARPAMDPASGYLCPLPVVPSAP